MKRIFKTVKARIIIIILCFSLAITTLVLSFSYYLIYAHQSNASTQSIEFNLQLVSQTAERDLVEAIALANWCGSGANNIARFIANDYNNIAAVENYERLLEEVRNSRTYDYINRVLILSNDGIHMLHAGRRSTVSTLTFTDKANDTALDKYTPRARAHIYDIAPDPYDRNGLNVLNIAGPVYAPSRTKVIGTVYMAINTRVFTDILSGYSLANGATLYLALNDILYRIEGDNFIPTNELVDIAPLLHGTALNKSITSGQIETHHGDTLDAINCRVRDGISLLQVFDKSQFLPSAGSWLGMFFGICLLILALASAIIVVMNRTISRPVALIRKKIDGIAAGNFSPDPNIESDSEIGSVGRGINKLSREVVELMETCVADEKQKRELEYRMLQSQINPHFLYNTLGTIKWMATLQKADSIAEMTTALSRLLRTVSKDLRKQVPLREELELLDNYFLILKYRYGGTVEYVKNIENDRLLGCYIPRFVLQPLMENAIFHGIEPKGRGKIELLIQRDGDDVFISLTDNGVGVDPATLATLNNNNNDDTSQKQLMPVGMRSVHHRIQNTFGEAYGLVAESEQNIYTKMTIRIPYCLTSNTLPHSIKRDEPNV